LCAIRLYDSARFPPHWSGIVGSTQFAVSHYDYKTGTWRTAAGNYSNSPEEETVLLFDAFAEAERYCREHVEEVPSIFRRVYDHQGAPEDLIGEICPQKITQREFGPRVTRRWLTNGVAQFLCWPALRMGRLAVGWSGHLGRGSNFSPPGVNINDK